MIEVRSGLQLGSSLRARAPADTLAMASTLMPSLGISRVTDITRMDRLGLPVFASVRPRGRALRVHAGKGLEIIDAKVGALMEALEFAVAEPHRTRWKRQVISVGELRAEWGTRVAILDLAPRMGPGACDSRPIDIVACEEVSSGVRLPMPAELVFVPFDEDRGQEVFGWTTNGLASGNTLAEATLHALFEVLERDAVVMDAIDDQSCWIEHDDLPAPFSDLAVQWRNTGVELSVRQLPNDFGLPCFSALLHEPGGAFVDLASGHGLHLDPRVALARAVCEAAQSRLSHVHGGRDDITHFYAKWHDGAPTPGRCDPRASAAWVRTFDKSRRVSWAELSRPGHDFASTSIDAVLAGLLSHLQARGFERVFRHHFAIDLGGLHVVKVIVPRCQEQQSPMRRLGRRLYDKMRAHA